jgi:hypothetical protein
MKAMNLMMQCCYMRSELIGSEAFNKVFLGNTKKVESDEEINRVKRTISLYFYFSQGIYFKAIVAEIYIYMLTRR